ncbi:MAG: hypothetical protein AVDCRST_MAG80-895 [uncultured Rubrobacteraceae bacterium]|uniref:Uncharacterized protein n=1 Tax=uncultured Rubrobacteraceae bacterium TaxID=349277 RepID=A0A6J4QEU3_9ACTN|nr:MAG: hypothetical protein AVDCRST_MAG80-895 [uncultured Rubrobacteraceae bacterium]
MRPAAGLVDCLLRLDGFHRVLCFPGIEAAFQGRRPKAHLI